MLKILIVDDQPVVRGALRRTLTRDGYEFLEAGSGEEGLARLAEHPDADIVISDMDMGSGMNGLEFLEQVRAQYPRVVRLMATSHDEVGLGAVASGLAFSSITKPWDFTQIPLDIARAVGQGRKAKGGV